MANAAKHFLERSENSVTREKIFVNRFEFDIRMAAARVETAISIGVADVDRNGYDVILDDEENSRKIQLKTVGAEADTSEWKVLKTFFRPPFEYVNKLGLKATLDNVGIGGSVVLMEISNFETGAVQYHYTDALIVRAFELELIKPAPTPPGPGHPKDPTWKKAYNVLRTLEIGVDEEQAKRQKDYDAKRVSIPEDLFLTIENSNQLLAVMGFHNTVDSSFRWPNLFLDHYLGIPLTSDGRIDFVTLSPEQVACLAPAATGLLQFTDGSIVTELKEPPAA